MFPHRYPSQYYNQYGQPYEDSERFTSQRGSRVHTPGSLSDTAEHQWVNYGQGGNNGQDDGLAKSHLDSILWIIVGLGDVDLDFWMGGSVLMKLSVML